MSILSMEARVRVAACLVDGTSIRATERITNVHRDTIMHFGLALGEGCFRLHDALVRDVHVRLIQCDEIWSYVAKKQARVTEKDPVEFGDAYTFLGMARTKKLIISYFVGKRDEVATQAFTKDLRARLVAIPEISTDGWASYQTAVGQSFAGNVDHAVIQKNYSRKGRADGQKHDHRYEPPRDPFITKRVGHGAPNLERASTSHIERANLTVRMHVRRFTRLCNGFSKKLDNHRAAVSLHVAWYNFCRAHESLRVTPAMEAEVEVEPEPEQELAAVVRRHLPPLHPPLERRPQRLCDVFHDKRQFLPILPNGWIASKEIAPPRDTRTTPRRRQTA